MAALRELPGLESGLHILQLHEESFKALVIPISYNCILTAGLRYEQVTELAFALACSLQDGVSKEALVNVLQDQLDIAPAHLKSLRRLVERSGLMGYENSLWKCPILKRCKVATCMAVLAMETCRRGY
jgi:hypothetical protein